MRCSAGGMGYVGPERKEVTEAVEAAKTRAPLEPVLSNYIASLMKELIGEPHVLNPFNHKPL